METLSFDRINAYRVMWLFVMFDLPVTTKKERRAASQFRKNLQKDGFTMMQYSIYTRHCASKEVLQMHARRIRKMMPPGGQVSILKITDKQYENIENFWGRVIKSLNPPMKQLEMF